MAERRVAYYGYLPEQRWIPVSERLPPSGVLCWVTKVEHIGTVDITETTTARHYSTGWQSGAGILYREPEVRITAWMPKPPTPEPYRGEK